MNIEDAKVCTRFEINMIMILERIAHSLEKLVDNDTQHLA